MLGDLYWGTAVGSSIPTRYLYTSSHYCTALVLSCRLAKVRSRLSPFLSNQRLMDIDIPIDPSLLPRATAMPLSQSTPGANLNVPFAQSTTGTDSDVDVLISGPTRDENGQLTPTGYVFRESLYVSFYISPLHTS
jgi:hypothetical protein